MTWTKTVIIIDDHPFIREGLKSILSTSREAEFQYDVIGEAGNGREASDLFQELESDFCLIDISLPDQNGIDLTRQLKRLFNKTRILILSMHSKIEHILKALQAGADGFLDKNSASDKLLEALDRISKGEYYLDTALSTELVNYLRKQPGKENAVTDQAYRTLSAREQEVLRMLAENTPMDTIAERLFISPKTVKNHRSRIMQKLRLRNSHDLVRYAVNIGLIDLEFWNS